MSKQGFGKTLSEIEFVALKKGKHHGFDAAYKLYADHVYSLCIHILGNEQTAADVMQTVFEILLNKSSSLQSHTTLGPWLKQCSINACMGYFRQIKQESLFLNHPMNVASETTDIDETNDDELVSMAMMNKLPTVSRSVVYSHAVQGLKHSEIAPTLGIKESNSRQLYSRAMKQLRSWLGKAD